MQVKFTFLFFFAIVIFGCNNTSDFIVAEVYHYKLYFSEVVDNIPYTETKEDSVFFMTKYIDDWILRKALLFNARKALSQKEQDFSVQLLRYKEQLLIHAYFEKLSNNNSHFVGSQDEVDDFLKETKLSDDVEYKEMVKLNYIKLSDPSKLYHKIKSLFFDDKDRLKSIQQLEKLCADTIEYYLDTEYWLYMDYIESELPFLYDEIKKSDGRNKFDILYERSRYLLIILDMKRQLQSKNIQEEKLMVQKLLQQKKRVAFFSNFQDSLVQKTLESKHAIIYPIVY